LRRHRRAVIELAARRGARNTRVFGSIARGEDTDASDVDLDDGVGVAALAGLQRELAELLGADVDLVPATTLRPGFERTSSLRPLRCEQASRPAARGHSRGS
jgi:hypothetical protein